jgi:hypothetical protein
MSFDDYYRRVARENLESVLGSKIGHACTARQNTFWEAWGSCSNSRALYRFVAIIKNFSEAEQWNWLRQFLPRSLEEQKSFFEELSLLLARPTREFEAFVRTILSVKYRNRRREIDICHESAMQDAYCIIVIGDPITVVAAASKDEIRGELLRYFGPSGTVYSLGSYSQLEEVAKVDRSITDAMHNSKRHISRALIVVLKLGKLLEMPPTCDGYVITDGTDCVTELNEIQLNGLWMLSELREGLQKCRRQLAEDPRQLAIGSVNTVVINVHKLDKAVSIRNEAVLKGLLDRFEICSPTPEPASRCCCVVGGGRD